jgi:potassium/hydrogen antiporter
MAMDVLYSLTGFCLVILIGFISESIFDKTHIPDMLILFIIGVVIGPVMNWVQPDYFSGFAPIFVTLALALIIFSGGINIKIDDFLKGATKGGMLSFTYFLASVLIVSSMMVIFGYPIELGILLGTMLGGTSSAIVIPILKLLKVDPENSIILTLESTLTDVYCIVGAVTVLQIIRTSTMDPSTILINLLSTFTISFFIGVIAAVIWSHLKQKIPSIEKAYMVSLASIILIYILSEAFRGNGAITVLFFAIVLGNVKRIFSFIGKDIDYSLHPSEKNFFAEISFFLKVFFFVYLGIIINFEQPMLLLIGFTIAVLIASIRPFIVKVAIRKLSAIPLRERSIMSAISAQGLASAALVQIILLAPELAEYSFAADLAQITLSVILFSIIITSSLIMIVDKTYPAAVILEAPVAEKLKN